jgi:hypothetical protein
VNKDKSIWSIAVRSSIDPFLGLIAFPLLALLIAFPRIQLPPPIVFPRIQRVLNLRGLLVSFIPGAIWVVGIYIAQRSYKATYQQMTYDQDVKVGFWTSFFIALWASLLISGEIVWHGKKFIPGFLGGQGTTLQTTPLLQESPVGLAALYDSLWFVLAIFIVTLILGTLISLVLSLFLRTKNQRPSQYAT